MRDVVEAQGGISLHFPVFNLPVLMTLLSIAPLSFGLNLQAVDGLLPPSIHFLPSDRSVTA